MYGAGDVPRRFTGSLSVILNDEVFFKKNRL